MRLAQSAARGSIQRDHSYVVLVINRGEQFQVPLRQTRLAADKALSP